MAMVKDVWAERLVSRRHRSWVERAGRHGRQVEVSGGGERGASVTERQAEEEDRERERERSREQSE